MKTIELVWDGRIVVFRWDADEGCWRNGKLMVARLYTGRCKWLASIGEDDLIVARFGRSKQRALVELSVALERLAAMRGPLFLPRKPPQPTERGDSSCVTRPLAPPDYRRGRSGDG